MGMNSGEFNKQAREAGGLPPVEIGQPRFLPAAGTPHRPMAGSGVDLAGWRPARRAADRRALRGRQERHLRIPVAAHATDRVRVGACARLERNPGRTTEKHDQIQKPETGLELSGSPRVAAQSKPAQQRIEVVLIIRNPGRIPRVQHKGWHALTAPRSQPLEPDISQL